MTTMADWLGAHPLTLALLTLAIGGLISVFSGDIRQFVKIQPQRLNVWILRARLNARVYELETVVKMKEDVHELLMFFFRLGLGAFAGFGATISTTAFEILSHSHNMDDKTPGYAVDSIVLAAGQLVLYLVIWSAFKTYARLKAFDKFKELSDKEIQTLKERIEKASR